MDSNVHSFGHNFKKSLLAVMLGAGLFAGTAGAETLRVAGNFAADHSSSLAMEVFKQEVETATEGDIKVQLFPAMQLGGATENVDQVRSGVLSMTWIGVSFLSRTVPELEAVSLPFVFKDRETAFRVIDGRVGELLNDKLADKGFVALGFMELGPRHITNSVRPIDSIDDFAGLKIRLQPNETHLKTFRALGASPTSMGINEVYSALQQKVIDGQENPFSIIRKNNYQEVQQYLTDTGHFFDFIVVVANKKRFDKLSAEEQQLLRDAMAKAVQWQREKAAEEDLLSREQLVAAGMQLNQVSPELYQQMQQQTAGIIEELKARLGDELVDAVLEDAKS
ncbi:C4-dicarboxylate ABC transporter substrate-binding protein [Zobellella denitrificans]|uniref:C4-dicarboxylate ABC transporter substrate-binding protein n=2 Tax=Zobellella denitrificans TaxID=347534 RepID=A0A231MUL1_9GAMM|nr:C4-dicarboxylate ABC transporter substrate-binding protein [Zobellella denitrificans]OXS13871.1 C4-dicarboxylate ABC transporter substrate-binding protein [Zobellella denitrificans]